MVNLHLGSDFDSGLYSIKTVDGMHKWFYSKWYSQLYRKGDPDTFLNFNYFVGENRMKITFRRLKKGPDSVTLKSKRLGDSFPPD
jgi:hypothetical protein